MNFAGKMNHFFTRTIWVCIIYAIFVCVHLYWFSPKTDRSPSLRKIDIQEKILRYHYRKKMQEFYGDNETLILPTSTTATSKRRSKTNKLNQIENFITANSNTIPRPLANGCKSAECICEGKNAINCLPKFQAVDSTIHVIKAYI